MNEDRIDKALEPILAQERLDNELVRQKNEIIEHINHGQVHSAFSLLKRHRSNWEANSYGYKVGELARRLLVWIEECEIRDEKIRTLYANVKNEFNV